MSSSPEGFFYLRNNFLSSHGTSSLVSWIMSIGDRHADNLLISKVSGESIPIDFGHAFGSAFFLPIPELGKRTQLLKHIFCIIQKSEDPNTGGPKSRFIYSKHIWDRLFIQYWRNWWHTLNLFTCCSTLLLMLHSSHSLRLSSFKSTVQLSPK